MSGVTRFSVSIEDELLSKFDSLIAERHYINRSEAVRDLIRDKLVEREQQQGKGTMMGVISLVYAHNEREVADQLVDVQHHHHKNIVSTLHVHLDENYCLEVTVARGRVGEIQHIAEELSSAKGVKHAKLMITSKGSSLK
jgi:CopG family nickel-responsive transcriptional regulator